MGNGLNGTGGDGMEEEGAVKAVGRRADQAQEGGPGIKMLHLLLFSMYYSGTS